MGEHQHLHHAASSFKLHITSQLVEQAFEAHSETAWLQLLQTPATRLVSYFVDVTRTCQHVAGTGSCVST